VGRRSIFTKEKLNHSWTINFESGTAKNVGFEIIPAVAMGSNAMYFGDIRRYGETNHLHLQGRKESTRK
jgi:hypothetical protein